MIETRFDQIEQILYIHYDGRTSIDELVNAATDFIQNNKLPDTLRILEFANTDLTKAPLKEWKKFKDILNVWIQHFSSVRLAVISHDPLIVANVILLGLEINQFNYPLNIFSTEAAARHWLSEN